MTDRTLELDKIPDLHAKAIHYVFEKNMVPDTGLWLEFGVYVGGTINRMALYTNRTIFGFDSFEGLPENWEGRIDPNGSTYPKGLFNLGGNLPRVAGNVKLIKGWYKDVLPTFITSHNEPITFIHIDCDIYSSTVNVLEALHQNIAKDCIIAFDELVGYNGFEGHEWKAWWEFVDKYNIEFEWIGGCKSGVVHATPDIPAFDRYRPAGENISPAVENVAVRITNNPTYRL